VETSIRANCSVELSADDAALLPAGVDKRFRRMVLFLGADVSLKSEIVDNFINIEGKLDCMISRGGLQRRI